MCSVPQPQEQQPRTDDGTIFSSDDDR